MRKRPPAAPHSRLILIPGWIACQLLAAGLGVLEACPALAASGPKNRPNILLCISDDQSWLHAGAYGNKTVRTPHFDRVARQGVLFTHAFCAAPSCTPSRSALLTGQDIWRLERGGVLYGTLPATFKVYPRMLEDSGYTVGFTGKGWAPGNYKAGGRTCDPTGNEYARRRNPEPPARSISPCDYAGNFADFLENRTPGKPFCFWYGAFEPHRPYEPGVGARTDKAPDDVIVPEFLPNVPEIRKDLLDYYFEIEWFDRHLGQMITLLEEAGELENTIIAVTSDNGMPFPRAKSTLYDHGVRMPLAICWGRQVKPGRVVDDLVSLTDLAPTFLEAAGLPVPAEMTGRSLLSVLRSDKAGQVDPTRDHIFTALERHAWCRPEGATYPMRALRTTGWLYIRNYEPHRWPAGDPDFISSHMGLYGEIDNGPAKTYMIEHKDDPAVARLFQLGFGRRPAEELYDAAKDPCQLHNLAADPAAAEVKRRLRDQLEQHLRQTGDPRAEGKSPWDRYPYYYKDYWRRASTPSVTTSTRPDATP
ncbi:MAG: sulfatase [Phycisphaerae bacterium]|nr:sulfatase [Phycisphaerae bacterium]